MGKRVIVESAQTEAKKKRREFVEAENHTEDISDDDIDATFDSAEEDSDTGFVSDGENSQDNSASVNTAFLGKKALFKKASDIAQSNSEKTVASSGKERAAKSADKPVTNVVSNRQRVLMIASRGIISRYRHLMEDLNALLPHTKKDSKLDNKDNLGLLNELAELNNCNNCMYFETRKHTDLYMWLSKAPNGPSVKFHIQNVHTMEELRMTGNCLKGSRHILSFDKAFDEQPHLQLIKEMLTQVFAVPKTSRKVKPFVDHVLSFSIADNRIWFRNYQIVENPLEKKQTQSDVSLVEIGPRFVMNPMRVFKGSFGGPTLYENSEFISPNAVRSMAKQEKQAAQLKRKQDQLKREEKMKQVTELPRDETQDIFA